MQTDDVNRCAVQAHARWWPVCILVAADAHAAADRGVGLRTSHLDRLEHVALRRRVEERKVQVHSQVVVRHVERNVLSTSEPARKGAHVLAREPQPERERTCHWGSNLGLGGQRAAQHATM
eukprot:5403550-Prymnesium_polylepis.1